MKKILCIYVAILLLAMPGVVAQVDGGLTRSGEVSTYDGTRADFLTVAGKLSRYPQLAKFGEELHYAPVVTTDSVNVDLSNVVNVFGNILFNGWYETVTAQGFQLSISSSFESSTVTEYPVIPVSSYTECDQPCLANVFSMTITDLTPDILYYVRAYATNADGTTYGEALPVIIYGGEGCPGTPIVTDADGNEYETVQIGTQCWTKTNLRSTKAANGSAIPAGGSTASNTEPYYYDYSSHSLPLATRGYLYNWPAANQVCPAGWHLPSDAEWTQLTNYVSSQSEYQCGGNSSYIAKALASTEGWNTSSSTCAVGNNQSANNALGFGAVPAGYWIYGFYNADYNADFWSSTESGALNAGYRRLDYSYAGVYRGYYSCGYGFSVRCLRDETGGGSGTTATLPTVTTGSVSDVTATSAMCSGEVTADGGAEVTARGVCWGTSETPTVADAHTSDGTGIGTFTSSISGLSAGTTYYVRAYATNSTGTAYGDQLTFETSSGTTPTLVEGDAIPCPGTPTVTDHEGNVYNTVKIGTQCWMKENLRTTTSPSTGTYLIPPASTDYTYTGKQVIRAKWRNPDNDSIMYVPQNYGLLYNWNAAVDTFNTAYGETSVNTSERNAVSVTFNGNRRGICPEGWHLPSDAEWTQLENYVGSQSEYICSGNSSYIAKALASAFTLLSTAEIGWPLDFPINNCAVSIDLNLNNATGFSAVLAGFGMGSMDDEASISASFWSSTQYGSDRAYTLSMSYSDADVGRYHADKGFGYSVRCLRDETGGGTALTEPTVTTSGATDVTETSATLNGSISNPDNVAITAQGFEWKATTSGAYVAVNATGETMTYNLTGLTAGTSYTYRAFVTTAAGTSYGSEVSFTTLAAGGGAVEGDAIPCPNTPTVTDHEGNVYATVQIGNQCWMRDNLRTTTSPSTGTYLIPAANANYTCTGKQARWYNNDSVTYAPMNYGLLYNWNAAVDTFNTAYGETSVNTSSSNAVSVTFNGHRRGICPAGWHLPSDAEWTQLENYVGSQSEYTCGGNSNNIAKALASTEGWNSYSGECYPGDQSVTANNATGFSAVPAGYCDGSSFYSAFYDAGLVAIFLSATPSASLAAYNRGLYYNGACVNGDDGEGNGGRSVRCLRDETGGGTALTEPTVTTSGATDVTEASATLNGSISNPDNVAITAQGFEWKATAGGAYVAVNATGETMTYNLTGLTVGTSYTYRAFVTTAAGTSYGEAVSFTTLAAVEGDAIPCPGTPTVSDHEGNVYNTVQIGTQCWMKENLRTTTSPSTGTYLIPAANIVFTYTGKQARWYNNDSATYAPMNYGLLYNWNAAVDTFNTAYGETSVNIYSDNAVSVTLSGHRRGICPAGWHLPSNAEWNTMERTVSGSDWQTNYETYIGYRGSHAGKLAGGDNWETSTKSGAPGDYSNVDRNVSGFSAVPAGNSRSSSFSYAGNNACFWSASGDDSNIALYRSLLYNSARVNMDWMTKYYGYSVRCLRD